MVDQTRKYKNISKSPLFKTLSQKDQILFFIYDYEKSDKISIWKCCYPVSSVSSVSSVSQKNQTNTSNKSNETNTLTTYSKQLDTPINRLEKANLIKSDKNNKPYLYSITTTGLELVESKYKKFLDEINQNLEKTKNERTFEDSISIFFEYFTQKHISNKISNNFLKGNHHYIIDFKDLIKFDPEICNNLLDTPEDTIRCSQIAMNQLFNVKDSKVMINNLPEYLKVNITKIRAKHLDKLCFIVGEIRSRAPSSVQVISTIFECPSCSKKIPILQQTELLEEPNRCTCGRKGGFNLIENNLIDVLKLSVNDLYENLDSYQVPEEINIIMSYDIFDFSKFNEGDRVRIFGIPKVQYIKTNGGKKKSEMIKYIKCVAIEKLEEDYNKIFITEEDEEKFKEIAKDPFKWHHNILFNDLDDIEFPGKLAILGLYGDLNLLFVGKPGVGKSQICTRIADVSLRGTFVNVVNASASGVLGSVTKNAFTGKYSLDGGVFRPMNPGGIVVLDELNRDNEEKPIQRTCYGIMSEKKLNIHKANTRVNENCDVSIWATANPRNPYDENRPEYDNFKLDEPLFDRFDAVIYFNNYISLKNIQKIVEGSQIKFKIKDYNIQLLKKYQIKSKLIDFKLDKSHNENIANLIKNFFGAIDGDISYRRINTMKRLVEAICKLHHRESPIKEDFVFLTDLIITLKTQKTKFLMDQKRF